MKLFTLVFGVILFITYAKCKTSYKETEALKKEMEAALKRYNKIREKLKSDAAVQGGSFSLNPPKPNRALQLDKKIPEKCKGKDTCHDFRLCKLCLPYWTKFNKLSAEAVKEEENSGEEDKIEEEKVGIDAKDPGYDEAYEVSKETEEEASGYDW